LEADSLARQAENMGEQRWVENKCWGLCKFLKKLFCFGLVLVFWFFKTGFPDVTLVVLEPHLCLQSF
jgi:hypothetical protein